MRVDKKTLKLEFEDNDNGEEYEVKAIRNIGFMSRGRRVANFQACTI